MTVPLGESRRLVLLLADLEGSTPLVASLGTERYEQVLDVVIAALQRAVADAGGEVVSFEGDGMVAVAPTVAAAVSALISAQRSLNLSPPPFGVRPRLRCGVHVGEASRRADGDVIGLGVHEAARVAGAAQGGQIVLSATARTAADSLGDAELVDAGLHHLRNFDSPQRLYLVQHVDLPEPLASLRAPLAVVRGLPAPRTRLVGRESDVEGVVKQLATSRLVTVVGAGGVGKSRVAVEAARELTGSFPDGAWFVDVTTAATAAELDEEVARRLQLAAGTDVRETLLGRLAEGRTLLLLDSCEHLIDEVAALADAVLERGGESAVLATSRERLAVRGEAVWRLGPLSVAGDGAAAVALLTERLVSLHGNVGDLGPELLAEAAGLVDGLPLALELVAARLADEPASVVIAELRTALASLEGGYRTDATRHRGLRAMLASTYDRLADDERSAFRRAGLLLSTVPTDLAAEVVGGGDPQVGAALLARLEERSLVESAGDDTRRVLEPLREVALELLQSAGEEMRARSVHATAVGRAVHEAAIGFAPSNRSADASWRGAADGLVANTRSALAWSFGEHAENTARLATDAAALWARLGLGREAAVWLERALEVTPAGEDRWRLLNNLAQIATTNGDPLGANRHWEELEVELAAGGPEADAMRGLLLAGKASSAMTSGDLVAARTLFSEAVPLLERAEQWTQLAATRMAYGGTLAALGDGEGAVAALEAGIEVAAAHGNDHTLAMLRLQLGVVAGMRGDDRRAAEESANAVDVFTALGDGNMVGMALLNLGSARLNLSDPGAGEALDEAVAVARRIGDRRLLVLALNARGVLKTGQQAGSAVVGDEPLDLAGGVADLEESATTAQLAGMRSEAAKAIAASAAARADQLDKTIAATTGEAVRLADADPAALSSVLARAAVAWAMVDPRRGAALAAAHRALAAKLGIEPQRLPIDDDAPAGPVDLDVAALAALAEGSQAL